MKVIKGQAAKQWKKEHGVSSQWELISQLIPIGLKAIEEELQKEVQAMVGDDYSRKAHGLRRWGSNEGSVFVGDTKVKTRVPRIRDVVKNREICLKSYDYFQDPQRIDQTVFQRVLKGLSTRDYESAAQQAPGVFGVKKSSVSRSFIRASGEKLKKFFEQRFDREDFVAIFIDGKMLHNVSMITALGIRIDGTKKILGFVEASTENHRVCIEFLQSLKERGLDVDQETLFVIDGAKGIRKAIDEVYGEKAFVQRCQWHKRENIVSYLPEHLQERYRRKLQAAYEQPNYVTAHRSLMFLKRELKNINESAVTSLEEGLEETLTLHRLNLFDKIGISFKTTNPIENLNRQLQKHLGKVCRWKNSNQRHRWMASACLEIEPKLRRVKKHENLMYLRRKMRNKYEGDKIQVFQSAA